MNQIFVDIGGKKVEIDEDDAARIDEFGRVLLARSRDIAPLSGGDYDRLSRMALRRIRSAVIDISIAVDENDLAGFAKYLKGSGGED